LTKNDIFASRVLKRYLTRTPVLRNIRHSQLSIICSADDDVTGNKFLADVSLDAIRDSFGRNLKDISEEKKTLVDSIYYDVFPGEHYRLLHSLAITFAPRSIIEVGTFSGMSSACMLKGMPSTSKLTTFDITSWREHRSHLTEEDFASGKITQILDDLSNPVIFDKYKELFRNSELIFCDAPKDGIFEHKFLANLTHVKPTGPCILILDDTRMLNMIDVWRSIKSPKLDLTSFGHWAGTGLVDISDGLRLG
jgi:predicted O-methyltransferase YrrM